jgi:hypothetical protein
MLASTDSALTKGHPGVLGNMDGPCLEPANFFFVFFTGAVLMDFHKTSL